MRIVSAKLLVWRGSRGLSRPVSSEAMLPLFEVSAGRGTAKSLGVSASLMFLIPDMLLEVVETEFPEEIDFSTEVPERPGQGALLQLLVKMEYSFESFMVW